MKTRPRECAALAELPAMSALVAQHERRHRLVGAARLNLVVGAVALATLAALEQIRFGALHGGQLCVVDRLLDEFRAQLAHLIAGHLLGRHLGQLLRGYGARHEIGAQRRILVVLEIGDARAHAILVAHVRILELGEDAVLQLFGQLVGRRTSLRLFAVNLDGQRQHFAAFDAHGVRQTGAGRMRKAGRLMFVGAVFVLVLRQHIEGSWLVWLVEKTINNT